MPVWLLWIHQRHQPILYTSRSSDHAPVDPVGMTRTRTSTFTGTLSCPLSMTRYPYRDRVIVGLVVMAVILVIQLIQWILS